MKNSYSDLFRKNYVILFVAFILSGCFLLICSKSSPLYPMNDWEDVHCFFTIGNSMVHGRVPYVDLYEQKGPVLYMLYWIIALISEHSFIAVYIVEVMTFGLFLYFSAKCAELYLNNTVVMYFIMIVLAGIIPVTWSFTHGASVEEMSLCMLAYSLYSILRAIKNERILSFKEAFLNGLFAGVLLWVKFTMLGFYVGLAGFVIVWYLWGERKIKELFITMGQFLLGTLTISLVVLVYFILNGGLVELFRVYFYNNIFVYTGEKGFHIVLFVEKIGRFIMSNGWYTVLMIVGLIWLLIGVRKHWKETMVVWLSFIGLLVVTYGIGKGYRYYGLILSVYTVFGLVALIKLFRYIKLKNIKKLCNKYVAIIMPLMTVGLLIVVYLRSGNTYLMKYDKEDLPQYKFAEEINKTEDATLLNYGFLDGGFYYAADIVPTCRFFSKLNISLPEMMETQNEYVEQGKVDFIITRNKELGEYGINSFKYKLVDEAKFPFLKKEYTYYLYQRLK